MNYSLEAIMELLKYVTDEDASMVQQGCTDAYIDYEDVEYDDEEDAEFANEFLNLVQDVAACIDGDDR